MENKFLEPYIRVFKNSKLEGFHSNFDNKKLLLTKNKFIDLKLPNQNLEYFYYIKGEKFYIFEYDESINHMTFYIENKDNFLTGNFINIYWSGNVENLELMLNVNFIDRNGIIDLELCAIELIKKSIKGDRII